MTNSEGSPVDPPLDVFVHQVSKQSRFFFFLRKTNQKHLVPLWCFEAEGYIFVITKKKGGRAVFGGVAEKGRAVPPTCQISSFFGVTSVQFPLTRHPSSTSVKVRKKGVT